MTRTRLLIIAFLMSPMVSCMADGRTQGAYSVTVAGSVMGKGTAAVSKKSVTLSIQVTDENGNKSTLHAANLPLVNGRFTGAGIVLGIAISITGRVDPPDQDGPIRTARILATFTDGNGFSGRLVGVLRGKNK